MRSPDPLQGGPPHPPPPASPGPAYRSPPRPAWARPRPIGCSPRPPPGPPPRGASPRSPSTSDQGFGAEPGPAAAAPPPVRASRAGPMPAELRQVGGNLVPGPAAEGGAPAFPGGPAFVSRSRRPEAAIVCAPGRRIWPGRGGGVGAPPEALPGAGSPGAGRRWGEPGRCDPERGAGPGLGGCTPGQRPGQVPTTGAEGEGFGSSSCARGMASPEREAQPGLLFPLLPSPPWPRRGFRLRGAAKEIPEGDLREALSAAAAHVRGGVGTALPTCGGGWGLRGKPGLGEACVQPARLPRVLGSSHGPRSRLGGGQPQGPLALSPTQLPPGTASQSWPLLWIPRVWPLTTPEMRWSGEELGNWGHGVADGCGLGLGKLG